MSMTSRRVLAAVLAHWRFLVSLLVLVSGIVLALLALIELDSTLRLVAITGGGILIVAGCWRLALARAVQREIRLQGSEALVEENQRLVSTVRDLQREVAELRSRKLQVLNVQPILELGIFEADCQISRCFDVLFDREGQPLDPDNLPTYSWKDFFLGQGRRRFVGMLTFKFTARYGVDMQNLHVRHDERAKTVYVAGAEPRYLGTKGFPETQWQGCVTLRQTWEEQWVADDESQRIQEPLKDFFRKDMEEGLRGGPEELNWLRRPLQNGLRHLLHMMIAPKGYSLELVEKGDEHFVPLFDYTAQLGLEKPSLPAT
jgi:hypothetical protein